MKLSYILISSIFSLILINFHLSKYIIKKKPKIPDFVEWTVPQVPDMAYDIYPGVEMHTLDQKYNELLAGEDIAQIETMVGKVLPMNALLSTKVMAGMNSEANKRTDR